mmetsp:Transcript_35885/g.67681  ORF Transcript_35885/g.67681 Transcript_35885/m.67681 type:complete len:204 (-) Transcript_35885:583-1194(-)
MGYRMTARKEMAGMTMRAMGVACTTATLLGMISQNMSVTNVSATVVQPTPASPSTLKAASVMNAVAAIPETVEPMRMVVRNRVMSCWSVLNGPFTSSSRAASSRTFQGHSVVMAVSLRLKNPNSTRLTAATASCTDTSCKLTNSGFGPRGTAPPPLADATMAQAACTAKLAAKSASRRSTFMPALARSLFGTLFMPSEGVYAG